MGTLRKAATRLLAKRPGNAAKPKAEAEAASAEPAADAAKAPAPNPMSSMILADIALRGGEAVLRRAVETGLLGRVAGAAKAKRLIKGQTMTQTLVGTALARIATRSVPGAIVVGGGLLAKTLYDRRKGRRAAKAEAAAPDAESAPADKS